jgi:hypothetical protein
MSWKRGRQKPLVLVHRDTRGVYIFEDKEKGGKHVEFDPKKSGYSRAALERFSEAILRADAKTREPINGENPILFEEHLYNRRRREINVASGTPDDLRGLWDKPGVTRGDGQVIYNRTHPQGRKVNSPEARRKHGASWYR